MDLPDAVPPAPGDTAGLRGQAVLSVKWNLVATVGKQGLRVLFMILVARIIGPHNYGIAGQAFIYIAFISVLRSEGFGSSLIRKQDLDDHDVGAANLLNLALGGALIGATLLLAPQYARFFHTGELVPVLRVLTLSVLFQTLAMVPQALLMRGLRFRPIAVGEVGGTLIGTAAGITAAYMGASYWSLVVQQVVMDFVLVVLLVRATGVPSFRGTREAARGVWHFGSRVLSTQLASYAVANADYIIVGRYLGTRPLGYYSLSYRTMMLPVANLGLVVNRVAYPVYAKIQDDRERMGRQFLLGSRLVALVAFPAMALVAVAAPVGVPVVFGRDWTAAIVPMQILAMSGALRSLHTLYGPVMLACGRAGWSLRFGLVTGAVYVTGFAVGANWGIRGVATAFSLTALLATPAGLALVGRLTGIRLVDAARSLVPVVVATAALVAAWYAASWAVGPRASDWATLAVAGTAAAGAYAATVWLRFPALARELGSLARSSPAVAA